MATATLSQKRSTIQSLPGILFIAVSLAFVLLFFANRKLYYSLLREDGIIEWLTFAGLFTSGVLALYIALSTKRNGYRHWFFYVFAAFALLAGLEEISWGQRIFGIESNEFFRTYSDQQETNLHNTFQGVAGIKTKHIALLVLFVYGVLLPLLARRGLLKQNWLLQKGLIIPPLHLVLPFLIATAFMFDFPSGMEEEIGEFFYSLCFVFLMWHQVLQQNKSNTR